MVGRWRQPPAISPQSLSDMSYARQGYSQCREFPEVLHLPFSLLLRHRDPSARAGKVAWEAIPDSPLNSPDCCDSLGGITEDKENPMRTAIIIVCGFLLWAACVA